MKKKETVLVTGAARGIGAAIVRTFLDRGYNLVANSLTFSRGEFTPASNLALVEGDIAVKETSERMAETAIAQFGSIDHVINNAGIFAAGRFTDYSLADFRRFVATNLESFIVITQVAVRQMLSQGSGGSVTTITAALAENPIAGVRASVPMITKGGLNAITLSLASEYAKSKIRFNAVSPSVVNTPMHEKDDMEYLKGLTPMGEIPEAQDVADAVLYLTEAHHVTGEVLHVASGAHVGKW